MACGVACQLTRLWWSRSDTREAVNGTTDYTSRKY